MVAASQAAKTPTSSSLSGRVDNNLPLVNDKHVATKHGGCNILVSNQVPASIPRTVLTKWAI